MATVILVIHLMVAATLVGLVLLQRSEGGALGIGGGGGGGFMSGRGAANMLTRVTAVVAALFFVTSISLTLIAQQSSAPSRGLEGFVPAGRHVHLDPRLVAHHRRRVGHRDLRDVPAARRA